MRVTTCGIDDLAEFIGAQRLTLPRGVYARHLVQITAGTARAIRRREGEAPLAIVGLYRWPAWTGRPSEAWFMTRDREARGCMTGICAAFRRSLREVARGHGAAILLRVRPGNRAGEVMARFAGFRASALVLNGARIWIYGGEHVGRR
ncbi:MAG: hypothetical protein ACLFPA_12725, partial [Dichotomicrobium sp.]